MYIPWLCNFKCSIYFFFLHHSFSGLVYLLFSLLNIIITIWPLNLGITTQSPTLNIHTMNSFDSILFHLISFRLGGLFFCLLLLLLLLLVVVVVIRFSRSADNDDDNNHCQLWLWSLLNLILMILFFSSSEFSILSSSRWFDTLNSGFLFLFIDQILYFFVHRLLNKQTDHGMNDDYLSIKLIRMTKTKK